ncbi:hypothetical protein GCM10020000_79040 [Streptomyces olivoverticillatus]
MRVARASDGLLTTTRIPAARSLITEAVRASRARPGRAGSIHAAGSAKAMSTAETTTADGAPSASATTPSESRTGQTRHAERHGIERIRPGQAVTKRHPRKLGRPSTRQGRPQQPRHHSDHDGDSER